MGYRHFTLPSGHIFGSLNAEYDDGASLEVRRSHLERYLRDIAAHPACLTEEPLRAFLEADDASFATAKIETGGISRYFNRPLKFYMEEWGFLSSSCTTGHTSYRLLNVGYYK